MGRYLIMTWGSSFLQSLPYVPSVPCPCPAGLEHRGEVVRLLEGASEPCFARHERRTHQSREVPTDHGSWGSKAYFYSKAAIHFGVKVVMVPVVTDDADPVLDTKATLAHMEHAPLPTRCALSWIRLPGFMATSPTLSNNASYAWLCGRPRTSTPRDWGVEPIHHPASARRHKA